MIDAINHKLEQIKKNSLLSDQNETLEYSIYLEVKEMFEWYTKTAIEKQAFRISLLKSLRLRKSANEDKLSSVIILYSRINESLPYIYSIKELDLTELIDLCNKEIKLIDREQSMFFEHVSYSEFQLAFSKFLNKEIDMNNILDRETIEAIHKLYDCFDSVLKNA